MVHQHSISFAAPSQLRLHMVDDGAGNAEVAVLNAYNQPIGSLHALKASKEEFASLLSGKAEECVFKNTEAFARFTMGTDHAHETLKVECEEPAKWVKMLDYVTIEEITELFEGLAVVASDGPSVI